MSNNFYSDEPLLDGGIPHPDDDRADGHRWDYVASDDDERRVTWETTTPSWAHQRNVPEEIRMLENMFAKNAWSLTRTKAFYEQAVFMAGYTDEADIVPFSEYYPVYRDMTTEQLRSYFTVRTMLRQGKTPETPLSYLFVYIYELLMQVGIDTPDEGYELLTELLDHYGPSEPRLKKHLLSWRRDYVVYYDLKHRAAEVFADEQQEDAAAEVIHHYADATDDDLFRVIAATTTYKYSTSAAWQKAETDVRAVVPRVIRAVAPIIEQQKHHHLDTLAFGYKTHRQHVMFEGAVFYHPKPVREVTFDISPQRQWRCIGGLWAENLYRHPLVPIHKKGEPFNDLFHETVRQLSIALRLGAHLRQRLQDEQLRQIITAVIRQYLNEKTLAARPKVSIDLTRLDRIRQDATVVCDLLSSPSHPEGEDVDYIKSSTQSVPEESQISNPTPPPSEGLGEDNPSEGLGEDCSLGASEVSFLRLVLDGKPTADFLRSIHTPAGVLVDSINTKMMDLLGDIVLEDDGSHITLIDDYRADIQQLIDPQP